MFARRMRCAVACARQPRIRIRVAFYFCRRSDAPPVSRASAQHVARRAAGVLTVISDTTNDDLAFLRNLLDGDYGAKVRRKFGIVYFFSGAVWAPYLLFEWLQVSKFASIPQEWVRAAW